MKKVLLLLVLFLTTSILSAQQNEVSFRIGTGSFYQLLAVFEPMTVLNGTPNASVVGNSSGILPTSIQYRTACDEYLSYSIEAQYLSIVRRVENNNNNEKIGEVTSSFYTVMPGFQLNFFDNEAFGLSTSFALGLGVRNQEFVSNQLTVSEQRYVLATQFDIVKLRFGKKFNVFTDIGLGTRSLVTLGIGYRF